ncbi:hypothetical protein B296_00021141 [Ensete ventricosum]|uniref:Uncharacterized protein n=1 Tax=Ensete ventricosum TaxID=4639 RepID=A0A426XSZ8_ENSVE|nr:hypothetical protein B296_00021141 [Ensete ventricosum]
MSNGASTSDVLAFLYNFREKEKRIAEDTMNLEPMTMNLKEGSRCVVNRGEDLTMIDFDDDVSLAEKKVVVLSTVVKN